MCRPPGPQTLRFEVKGCKSKKSSALGIVLLDSGFGIYTVGLLLRIHVSLNPGPSEFRGQGSEATRDRRVRCMQSRKGLFGFGFRVLCFVSRFEKECFS